MAGTKAGAPLFPHIAARPFNRTLNAIMAKLEYVFGPKFSPRAFRRGAKQEINDIGSTLSAIIQPGDWAHSGYRAYLDLQADYAINFSSLIISALVSDSDDPDHIRPRKEKRIRKQMKWTPVALVDATQSIR